MAVPPFPLACCVAAAVWLEAEVAVARETVRRFRARESRRLAVLACLCAVADIAVAALGVCWLHGGIGGMTWSRTFIVLGLAFVPVAMLLLVKGVCATGMAVLGGAIYGDASLFALASFFFIPCLLLLVSPVVRYRLLRRPARWKLALFACLTAYLPLLPFFAAMVWSGK